MRGVARVDQGNRLLSSELNPEGVDGGKNIRHKEQNGGKKEQGAFKEGWNRKVIV